jgi:ZIP family zinc transporter
VSETQTLLLGFIAGVTILIGLPLGKVRAPRPGLRQFLNAVAIGILLFLIWDVLVHGSAPCSATARCSSSAWPLAC